MAHAKNKGSRQTWLVIALGAVLVGSVPVSQSVDYLLNAISIAFVPSHGESPEFEVDTWLDYFEPQFGDSTAFHLDTSLVRPQTAFASSAAMGLDTGGANRTWGDSETFTYDNPVGCVGPYTGHYSGASSGTLQAYYDCNHTISFTFISYFGNVDFQSVVEVEPDGTVFGTFSGATLNGTFDSGQCTASGTWHYAGYTGTWSLARSEPGPCVAPNILLVPSEKSASSQASIGIFAVLNSGAGSMLWTANAHTGTDWLRTAPDVGGENAGLVFFQYDENTGETARVGSIRVTAPAAVPSYRDVIVRQSGTASEGQVTHFEFDPIEGSYMVDEPIPVTIRAVTETNTAGLQVDTTFNECAMLSTNSAATISPNRLCFENGVLSEEVHIDSPFQSLILIAQRPPLFGQSNPFNVQSATGETGCIEGSVWRRFGTFFGDGPAEVQLYSADGTLLTTQTTSDRTCSDRQAYLDSYEIGRFCFCDLVPGDYQLAALQGVGVSLRSTVTVSSGRKRSRSITLDDSSKPPVLFVPGILGSREQSWRHLPYPVITGIPGHIERDDLHVIDFRPQLKYVWRSLRLALQPHFRVVEAPWDWRATINGQVVYKYLIEAINDAKKRPDGTEWPKVHVVAHSAGGLLVRHYIQSNAYQYDIESFAMVGTPNQGAAIVYFLWQGADAARADEMAGGSLYEKTFERIYNRTKDDDFTGKYKNAHAITLWRFMRRYTPGLGDLMMTTPFLLRGCQAVSDFLLCQEDFALDVPSPRLLDDLRNSDARKRMSDEDNTDTDPDKVRTKLFLSRPSQPGSVPCTDDLKAVARIRVGPRQLHSDLYQDGEPTAHICGPGDGTVLFYDKSSVGLDHISQVRPGDEAFQEEEHVLLMRAYAKEICTFLNNNVPCDLTVAHTEEGEDEPDAWLSVSIDGRVQPFLISPDGGSAGVDPVTGDVESTINDAELEIGPRSAGIFIPDPHIGVYELQLTVVPGDVFTVEVFYADADAIEETSAQGIYHDGIISLMIDLDTTTSPALAISAPLNAPGDIRTEPIDGIARIVWDAPDDPLVTGYKVYARPHDMPKFMLLGTTAETHFDTGHPWNVAGSAPTWHYFVTAVAEDDTESFFTEIVENRHPLVAGFDSDVTSGVELLEVSFTDLSLGEVLAWAWDFDGDGEIDSTEQNPTFVYETPGTYSVVLTVGGPEGTDTTIRPGYVTVEPIVPPLPPVPGDFNGDGIVDLLDHEAFTERMDGPFVDPIVAGWHLFDLDFDYDVDLRDFAIFQNLFGDDVCVVAARDGLRLQNKKCAPMPRGFTPTERDGED